MNNKILIQTKNKNKYSLISNSGIIISEDGLENSSNKRLELLSELDNNCCLEEKKSFNKKDTQELIKKHGLTELILEVTSACNLRCTYCIFGEKYKELRKHENKNMSFETAKRAIDEYIKLILSARIHNPSRMPTIGFYGGEPLLNFDLIKKCTEYVKSIYTGKIFITLTSNAYLITDEILYFFKNNDIVPIFSLDGPKEEHDLHRVNLGGKGTFDVVIEKLNRAYEIFSTPIFVNSVYSYDTNLNNVVDFFAKNPQFICLNLTDVSPVNTTYYDDFTSEIINKFILSYNLLKEEFYEYVKSDNKDFTEEENRRIYILDLLFSRNCINLITKELFSNNNPAVKYTSTCIPGDRIFVDVNGLYHTCEKVSRSRSIGNSLSGLDFEEIAKYMNEFNRKIVDSCSACKIKKICPVCYNTFLKDGEFVKDLNACKCNYEGIKQNFSNYCYLNELDETWLGTFRTNYYKKVKELVVTLK